MKKLPEHTEKELLRELKKGSAEAFDALFNTYGKRLYFFALGYLKSEMEAEEVVQEVFFKIWKKRELINPELSFKAYIFKIAFNHIRELFQKLNLQRAYQHEIINQASSFSNRLDEQTNYQSFLDQVNQIINQLPPRQKDILLRKRQQEQSIKEIASELELSPKTVENHLTQALKQLRKALENRNIGGELYYFLFIKN